jgi:nitrate reductase delta subunit
LNKSANIGFRRKPAGHAAAAEQVRRWTRERFALPEDAVVMVAEVVCAVPGCPPLETVVAFWTESTRHHFKVFKPLAGVVADDLPPAFLKNALADIEGIGCECC